MGKLCCSQEEEAGFNLLGLLVAFVIALVFMLAAPPPLRRHLPVLMRSSVSRSFRTS
jgi:hypothetical protein